MEDITRDLCPGVNDKGMEMNKTREDGVRTVNYLRTVELYDFPLKCRVVSIVFLSIFTDLRPVYAAAKRCPAAKLAFML